MKVISLFNHKGGVSKTTTTFNLGWKLAEKGYRTLIVDADPQCNLTGLVANYNNVADLEDLYEANPECDIYNCLEGLFQGRMEPIQPAKPLSTPNEKLGLLAGDIRLAESETQVSVAITTKRSLPAMQNIPGSFGSLFRMTAKEFGYDYILIDMIQVYLS